MLRGSGDRPTYVNHVLITTCNKTRDRHSGILTFDFVTCQSVSPIASDHRPAGQVERMLIDRYI